MILLHLSLIMSEEDLSTINFTKNLYTNYEVRIQAFSLESKVKSMPEKPLGVESSSDISTKSVKISGAFFCRSTTK